MFRLITARVKRWLVRCRVKISLEFSELLLLPTRYVLGSVRVASTDSSFAERPIELVKKKQLSVNDVYKPVPPLPLRSLANLKVVISSKLVSTDFDWKVHLELSERGDSTHRPSHLWPQTPISRISSFQWARMGKTLISVQLP